MSFEASLSCCLLFVKEEASTIGEGKERNACSKIERELEEKAGRDNAMGVKINGKKKVRTLARANLFFPPPPRLFFCHDVVVEDCSSCARRARKPTSSRNRTLLYQR